MNQATLAMTAPARDWLFPAMAGTLAVQFVVGGTAQPVNVAICFMAALPLLYLLLAGARRASLDWVEKTALLLFGLAWLQLVPLPPALWTALAGRELATQVLLTAGLPLGWRPLALDPGAAAAALLSLVAPLAVLVGFARLREAEQRTLLRAIVSLAVMTALLGLMQRVTGSLTLYDPDHAGYATGLFANRNHHAVFLACALMLLPSVKGAADRRFLPILLAAAAVLFVGILATTSRAGIVLGSAALLASLGLLLKPSRRLVLLGVAGAAIAGIALLQVPALAPVFERFADLADDQRLIMAEGSWIAAREFLPWGSGWGSFVPVYMAFEDLDTLAGRYVVAAHNDYLQLIVEGGLLGLLIGLAGPLALAVLALQHLRQQSKPELWGLWGVAALLLLHSLVDFPLRTEALAAMLAIAFAAQKFAIAPLPADARGG